VLAVNAYPVAYIDQCQARMAAQLVAYDAVAAGASGVKRAALATFEQQLFLHLTVVLDGYFVHRTRGLEGKDGNALNEVRMLSSSILRDGGVLAADKSIRYRPEASVCRIKLGEPIRIDRQQFAALFHAYFAELRKRFAG